MKKLVDLTDPFFAPVWVRVSVVLVTAMWGLLELISGSAIWGTIFIGISAVCGWRFAAIDYRSDPED